MDRVRELGDASVPFGFDVHALFFSDDPLGVETQLHHALAAERVNRINLRREYFYATPGDVKKHWPRSRETSLSSTTEQKPSSIGQVRRCGHPRKPPRVRQAEGIPSKATQPPTRVWWCSTTAIPCYDELVLILDELVS